jgi:glycosyltransferase involved in cell wall biosynthesis
VSDVVVVDDGSTDATADAARETGVAVVVRQERNRGKAKALEAGFTHATGDLLLLLDADLCETACEAAALVAPVVEGKADMTIATFPVVPGRGGGRGIVVRLARAGIRRATGRTMVAPLSGQRCLTRAAFQSALPFARGFGIEVGLSIDVLRAGFRVVEIETQMDHRVTQNDWRAQRHRLRQLRDVALALLPRLLVVAAFGRQGRSAF